MTAPADSEAATKASGPIKILFVAGPGRVGSTLLGGMLGQIEGFFYVGELRVIWRRSIRENRPCGCGQTFAECEIWREVLREAFGDVSKLDLAPLLAAERKLSIYRTISGMFPSRRRKLYASVDEYRDATTKLYHAIGKITGCRVIVDTSHLPIYGKFLESLDGLDVRALHLTRDARAVAYSWRRVKVQPGGGEKSFEMRRPHPAETSMWWSLINMATERTWGPTHPHYLFLRYEDFIAEPQPWTRRIMQLVDESPPRLPFDGERSVVLGPTHCVFGNPGRFKYGSVPLRSDDEWRGKLKRTHRAAVAAVAWPWLKKYGYFKTPPADVRADTAASANNTDAVSAAPNARND
ncbi:MAG: sulfotransferase domain-containing protein [Planctomycetales bacterium]|nr:sulfotransferase domain-containing protein [Planctomycetales bacterium]